MEKLVLTTNIQHTVNNVNFPIYIYIYIYDNKNHVPFRWLRYLKAERRFWIMPFKDAQRFNKSRRYIKILDTSYVPWRKFHTEVPPISRHCCTKYSSPCNMPPVICAPLQLLKTIFKHNSMHLILQVHRTETMRRWSAANNRFWFRNYRIVLNFLLTDKYFPLEIMKSSTPPTPPWLIDSVGPVCWPSFVMITLSL